MQPSADSRIVPAQQSPTPEWLQPAASQSGFRRSVEAVRSRLLLVIAIVVVVTGASVAFVAGQDDVYEADASLLVSPMPADDPIVSSLGVIRESSDPTLDVQTAAQLIVTREVAELAAQSIDADKSADEILNDVRAEPVGQSNIVAILARAPTAQGAQELANAVGEAAVEVRTNDLHKRIDELLPRLEAQRDDATGSDAGEALSEQIAQLQSLRAGPDPTIRMEARATEPESRIWPRPILTVAGGLLLGVVLGVLVAYMLRALDPRLRREDQLRESFRLPLLARIPREASANKDMPLRPASISPATTEAYRTLRATLTVPRGPGAPTPKSLLVTSPSPGEGKTSTAVNLAFSLARAGSKVILIESDLRRPSIEQAVGVGPAYGIAAVLRGEVPMADALVRAPGSDDNLWLLMAGRSDGETSELFSLPMAQHLIDDAEKLADYVVVDSPPLAAVVDSMPLAQRVDRVLVVVHLGRTHLRRIRELGEILAGSGVRPAGFALLGTTRPGDSYYYADAVSSRGRQPRDAGLPSEGDAGWARSGSGESSSA